MSSDPFISVVMPFYNEGTVITQTVQETVKHLSLCCSQFEILCIDDGSTDLGPEYVTRLSTTNPEVQLIRLSRNFGKEAALAAGLELAQGTAVVIMDADMQHPPSLLPTMVTAWQEGHHLVEAVKNPSKSVSVHHRFASAFFHRLMGLATDRNLVGDADFKLLDRQVVEAINQLPERTRYFRGLVAWVGFASKRIAFDVPPRLGGQTKWGLLSLIRYSVRNLVAFSSLPLRIVAWLGFITVGFGLILGIQTLGNYLAGIAVEGFTTTIVLMIILSGAILTSLGVVATYIGQMYDELKGRPTFIILKPDPTRPKSAMNNATKDS